MQIIQISNKEDLIRIQDISNRAGIVDKVPDRAETSRITNETIERREPLLLCILRQYKTTNSAKQTEYLIFASTPEGRKCCITATGLDITIDVEIPASFGNRCRDFATFMIGSIKSAFNFVPVRVDVQELFPSHGFTIQRVKYLRIKFNNTEQHYDFVRYVNERIWPPAQHNGEKLILSDDDANYYHKIARSALYNTAGWVRVSGYQVLTRTQAEGCTVNITVPITGIEAAEMPASAASIPCQLIESWDIETYKKGDDGIAPASTDEFDINVISAVYGWHMDNNPVLTAAFVHWPGGKSSIESVADAVPEFSSTERMDWVICCDTLELVIRAKFALTRRMRPDFTVGFNTEKFDWPNMLRKIGDMELASDFESAYSANILYSKSDLSSILKYNFRNFRVKIDAETDLLIRYIPQFRGVVDIDVSILIRRAFSKNPDMSLNYWLKRCKIPGKRDMPYLRMFRIYERFLDLQSAPVECHCNDIGECACCRHFERYVDGKQYVVGDAGEGEPVGEDSIPISREEADQLNDMYSTVPLTRIAGRCCLCGKRPQNVRDMMEVAFYCVIDSHRTLQLLNTMQFINNAQSIANVTYTDVHEGLYMANGKKNTNFIGSMRRKLGFAHSSQCPNEYGATPTYNQGAYVLDPEVQICAHTPQANTDVQSLYPNVMIKDNISHEKQITRTEVPKYRSLGYEVNEIGPFEVETGAKKGDSGNRREMVTGYYISHRNVHLSESGRNIVERFDKVVTYTSPDGRNKVTNRYEMARIPLKSLGETAESKAAAQLGWKRSVSYLPVEGREALIGEDLSVIARCLMYLIQMRKDVRERIEKLKKEGRENGAEMPRIIVLIGLLDGFQNAVKIITNAIYGALGQFLGALYSKEGSGSVTHGGRTVLIFAKETIIRLECGINYGDTDSLMFTLIVRFYEETERKYRENCRKFGTDPDHPDPKYGLLEKRMADMVEVMNRYISEFLIEKLYDLMIEFTGSLNIKMIFERIGAPWGYSSKKRYFVLPYEKRNGVWAPLPPNLSEGETDNYNQIYKKGYDIIKSSKAPIMDQFARNFFLAATDLYQRENINNLMRRMVEQYYDAELLPRSVIKYNTYRPTKRNVAIHTMVNWTRDMAERAADPIEKEAYAPPAPGVRFPSLIVDRPTTFTLAGKIHHATIGESMMQYKTLQYLLRRDPKSITVNKTYYMNSVLASMLAQFIVGDPIFSPSPEQQEMIDRKAKSSRDSRYKIEMEVRRKNAKKSIIDAYNQYSGLGDNALAYRSRGKMIRTQYHHVEEWLSLAIPGRSIGTIVTWIEIVAHGEIVPRRFPGMVRRNRDGMVTLYTGRGYPFVAKMIPVLEYNLFQYRTKLEIETERILQTSAQIISELSAECKEWHLAISEFTAGRPAAIPILPDEADDLAQMAMQLGAMESFKKIKVEVIGALREWITEHLMTP